VIKSILMMMIRVAATVNVLDVESPTGGWDPACPKTATARKRARAYAFKEPTSASYISAPIECEMHIAKSQKEQMGAALIAPRR
jgi:hypothetical protein